MKVIFSVLVSFFFVGSMLGQGIEFYDGTWKETLAKAKEEQKLIFVDAYTTWCGPCKRMAKNVFTQESVGKVFNERFINSKMDMEAEKNMGFVSKYPVSAYPTLMFINGDGDVILKKVGGQQVDGLLALADEAEKLDDRSVDFEEGYAAGNRDYEFVLGYIQALNKVGKSSLKISNDYLKSEPSISDNQMDGFLVEAATEADSKLFDQLIARKESILKTVNHDELMLKVKRACDKTVNKGAEFEIIDLVDEAVEKYSQFHDKKKAKEYGYKAKMNYYKGTGLIDEYATISSEYFKKVAKKDNEKLKPLIDQLAKHRSNEQIKELLLTTTKQQVKNEDNWKNLITYANALLLNDDMSKAMEVATKALSKTDKEAEKSAINKFIKKIESKV